MGWAGMTPQDQSATRNIDLTGRFVVILGTAIIALCTIFSILFLDEQEQIAWRAQLDLVNFEQKAAQLEGNEWRAMAQRKVGPTVAAELAEDKKEILQIVAAMSSSPNRRADVDQLVREAREYVQAIDHELILLEANRYLEAQQVNDQEVDPRFDRLEQTIAPMRSAYHQRIRTETLRSELGLILAMAVSAGLINFLFMHSERAKRSVALAVAERFGLWQSERRFRTLTEKSGDIIIILDAEGSVKYVSPSVQGVLGLQAAIVKGHDLLEYVRAGDAALVKASLKASMVMEAGASVEFHLLHRNGAWLCFECVPRNLLSDPSIAGLVLNLRDVTARKRAEQELLFSVGHDGLTGLPNRALFLERLRGVIDRLARHPEQSAAVLFIDIDNFKVINDSLGHEAGDELMIELGKRIRTCLRTSDIVGRVPSSSENGETVARMGGDEFTVLLEDVRNPDAAMRVAQRIRELLEDPFELRGQKIQRSASVGVALTSPGIAAEDLMRNADIAMHRAKKNGKSCCELFDADLHAQVMTRLQAEADLRRAVERQEFRLYYQPVITLATEAVEGFEALVRWERPGCGLVPPGEFIPMAEDTGLIMELGAWVLTEACRQAICWQEQPGSGGSPYVSVNISGKQFSSPSFLHQIEGALQKSGLSPHLLKLELTESVAMENAPRTEQILGQIQELGVKLSIDDFGTGYSSLSYLRRFPIDTLKIDKSFVLHMHENNEACTIVRTIVALARSLQMEVVAEGLETPEQLKELKAIVCDAAQGYFFAKPMPATQSLEFLAQRKPAQARAAAAGDVSRS
jgi:diguanylate cyclase (GGDEF)-like protein/PAS domain S-box-containing protein